MTTNQALLNALNEGATICWGPNSKALVLLNKFGAKNEVQLSKKEFFALRTSKKIKRVNIVTQGHHFFSGRVDSYVTC